MNKQQARKAATEGRTIKITAGKDEGFRGMATRVFTVNGEQWMHVKKQTGATRYALLADVDLV